MKACALGSMMLAAVLFAAVDADASCGSSSCPIDLQSLLDLGRSSLDLSFQYIDQNQPRIGTRKAHVGEIASEHDEIRTLNRLTNLQFQFAVSPRFQLALTAPLVSRVHEHRDTESQEIERWDFRGFGDAVVQARTRLFISEASPHPSLWLTTGVKLPTGARHEASNNSEDAEVTIEPGTGSTDLLLGLTWQSGVLRNTALGGPMGHSTLIPWFVAASVRANGRGTNEYRRGHELQLNTGTEYPLSSRLHLLGQLNARMLAKDDPGHTLEDRDLTGGRFIYASPGIRALLGHGASAYAFVQIPLYQHVNELQLTSKVNYVIGFRRQF